MNTIPLFEQLFEQLFFGVLFFRKFVQTGPSFLGDLIDLADGQPDHTGVHAILDSLLTSYVTELA
jgi:hypothetical protein